MGFRFEFDALNKVLLLRLEGPLTDQLLAEVYQAVRERSEATNAGAGIIDFSSVTEIAVSAEFIRKMARRDPAMPDPSRPRFLVVPIPAVFGLARMFQILGESTRPLLQVVHTMDEALSALGIQRPRFEPLA